MNTVSVVIPTIGRSSLRRAVESALSQGEQVIEVLVMADTDKELDLPADHRVSVERIGPGAGGNVARNRGIALAHGDLIAFLDDDDMWIPGRLREQSPLPGTSGNWIAATRCLNMEGSIHPTRIPAEDESIADYMFASKGLPPKKGALVTSTLLVPAHVARREPWNESLRYHQDLDWILSLSRAIPDLAFFVDHRAFVIADNSPASVSKRITVSQSLEWARERLLPASSRAYADFLLTRTPLRRAVQERSVRDLTTVWRALFTERTLPSFSAVAFATAYTLKGFLRPNNDTVQR